MLVKTIVEQSSRLLCQHGSTRFAGEKPEPPTQHWRFPTKSSAKDSEVLYVRQVCNGCNPRSSLVLVLLLSVAVLVLVLESSHSSELDSTSNETRARAQRSGARARNRTGGTVMADQIFNHEKLDAYCLSIEYVGATFVFPSRRRAMIALSSITITSTSTSTSIASLSTSDGRVYSRFGPELIAISRCVGMWPGKPRHGTCLPGRGR